MQSKHSEDILEDILFETKPIGLSEWELWCKLNDLTFVVKEESVERHGYDVGTMFPAAVTFDEIHGWCVFTCYGDPRLEKDDCWKDRIIGVGETIQIAIAVAEQWAVRRSLSASVLSGT